MSSHTLHFYGLNHKFFPKTRRKWIPLRAMTACSSHETRDMKTATQRQNSKKGTKYLDTSKKRSLIPKDVRQSFKSPWCRLTAIYTYNTWCCCRPLWLITEAWSTYTQIFLKTGLYPFCCKKIRSTKALLGARQNNRQGRDFIGLKTVT